MKLTPEQVASELTRILSKLNTVLVAHASSNVSADVQATLVTAMDDMLVVIADHSK